MIAKWRQLVATLLSWGPAGLFVLAVLDSAGVPIVGGVDALLIAIAVSSPNQAYIAAGCAILGSLTGSLVLFGIARKGGEIFLSRQIRTRQGARLHSWFERYGMVTVFVPALSPLPLPMKVPVFCAGALRVRPTLFAAVVGAARIIRYFALAYLGMHYGQRTFQFLGAHLFGVLLFAFVLSAAAVIAIRLLGRKKFFQGRIAGRA